MRTVIRPLIPRMEYGLRLFIKRIPYSFLLVAFNLLFINCLQPLNAQGVSCFAELNISINNNRPTRLHISALTPRTNTANLVVDIPDRDELIFNCEDVGREIMVTLRDTMSNSRCMTRINVEDKDPLFLNCDALGIPSVFLTGSGTAVTISDLFPMDLQGECGDFTLLGSKVNQVCREDSDSFTPTLLFCSEELNTNLYIEIIAQGPNGESSNICSAEINLVDADPPIITPLVDAQIFIQDNDERTITLDTSDIILSLTDNSSCINSLVMTGSGIGTATGSGLPFFQNGTFMTFTCADTGSYDVEIIATDCQNNADTVLTQLTVDPNNVCNPSPSTFTYQANIMAQGESPLQNVSIIEKANESKTYTTDLAGSFSFTVPTDQKEIQFDISYTDHPLREVSVLDLKWIQDRILGRREFVPWQEASADFNGSGSITALDIVDIRRLMLGETKVDIESKSSWLFSANQDDNYENSVEIHLDNLSNKTPLSISSIKRGDVNGSASKQNKVQLTNKVLFSTIQISDSKSILRLDLSELPPATALQLSGTIEGAQILEYTPIMDVEINILSDNQFSLLMYTNEGEKSLGVIDLILTHNYPETEINVQKSTSLSSHFYDSNLREIELDFQRTVLAAQFSPHRLLRELTIYPNPSMGSISLYIPESLKEEPLEIIITRANGSIVESISRDSSPQESIELPNLPSKGIYFAMIQIGGHHFTRKIIKI